MIIYKATIAMRDDTTQKYDWFIYPYQSNEYWVLQTTQQDCKYIPKEAIESVSIKDTWQR